MDKPIWLQSTPEQKVILITLLMMANNEEKEWMWNGKKFKAMPGQFVTSIESIAKFAGKGITNQNIRTALNKLKSCGFLTDESTNTGRLITISNWASYQGDEKQINRPANRQLTTNKNKYSIDTNVSILAKDSEIYSQLEKNKVNVINFIKKYNPNFIEPYIDIWNIWAGERGKPKVTKLTSVRQKKFKVRIQEKGFDFIEILTCAAQSDFILQGNWFNWDWIMENESNYLKVLEGHYKSAKKSSESKELILDESNFNFDGTKG